MADMISGSCLCGKVEFELKNQFENLFFCHCIQCRKITGSSHASNLFGDPSSFKWVKGQDHVKRFDLPERQFAKAFCHECGSSLPYLNSSGTKIIVPAGSLETEPNYKQQSNIFTAEQTRWHHLSADAENFDGFPTGEE